MTAWTFVVAAGPGGRDLLRTADSIALHAPAAELLLAVAPHGPVPLQASVEIRLRARAFHGRGSEATAINCAASSAGGARLAIVPSGILLRAGSLERADAVFGARPSAALASPLRVTTADGIGTLRPPAAAPADAAAMLTDPRSVPPALIVNRETWASLGGLDESLGELAMYDLWLRLALGGAAIAMAAEPLFTSVCQGAMTGTGGDAAYLATLRRVFEKHHDAIAGVMHGVLVAREVRFGRLRETHRQLLVRRDAELAELDRLRADTAHHVAYLRHHGRDRFDWGDLRRVDPVSRDWGYDRGLPVDRPYIEAFLESRSSDVHGAVLEVQEDDFTRLAGGARVTSSSVVDIDPDNPRATVIADLRCAPELPGDHFDCVILTQTIHVIDDMEAVARETHRVLRPGGVLLATLPAASRVCLEYGETGDLWRVTPAGARAVFQRVFGDAVDADPFGNVLSNVAFLHGLASHELTPEELDIADPYFPLLTGIRARKGGGDRPRGVVLLYHRIAEGPDVHGLNVPPALFDAHLEWLQRQCALVPLDRLLDPAAGDVPPRAVALTFDDGYADNLEAALPLLQRRGVPATFFATTRWLDEDGEYWWDTLERVLLDPGPSPSFLELETGGESFRFETASPAQREAAHWRLHAALVHASVEERERVIARLSSWRTMPPSRHRPMRRAELQRLAAAPGVTLGVHTINHLALPDQPAEIQMVEMAGARDTLAELTGRPIDLFAYPYGAVDRDTARLARRHFRWGFSCESTGVPASFDAARVPRFQVKAWEPGEFAARIDALLAPVVA